MVDSSWDKRRVKRPVLGQTHNKCRNEQLKRYIAAIQRVSDGQRARRGCGPGDGVSACATGSHCKGTNKKARKEGNQPSDQRTPGCLADRGLDATEERATTGGRELGTGTSAAGAGLAPEQSMCKSLLCECSLRGSHTPRARHARIGGEEALANKARAGTGGMRRSGHLY